MAKVIVGDLVKYYDEEEGYNYAKIDFIKEDYMCYGHWNTDPVKALKCIGFRGWMSVEDVTVVESSWQDRVNTVEVEDERTESW